MILHLYFARRFAVVFGLLTLIFWALIALTDLIEQARRFSPFDLSFGELVKLTLIHTPQSLNQILPLIMILSSIVLFLALARSSELVVSRAAGRSALRSLLSILGVTVMIGALVLSVFNPLVASSSKRYETLANAYLSPGSSAITVSENGLWLRQGDANGQSVIRASRANTDGSVLFDVSFYRFPPVAAGQNDPVPHAAPKERIEAKRATLTEGQWQLSDAVQWQFVPQKNPESFKSYHDTLEVPTPLTLDSIQERLGDPAHISIWDMPAFLQHLRNAGFSTRRHEVAFQSELARPLFLIAMVLMGAAFTMRQTRAGGIGSAVLLAVMLGFGIYFIRSFAQILGENGQIPILLAAWAPPVAAICLALGILLHKEDG